MKTSLALKTVSRLLPAGTKLGLLAALLAGCASTQPKDPYNQSANRKAAETNTSLGTAYMQRGQYEIALGKLKLAVADDPGYAPARTVLAILYDRLGEKKLAGENYRKAIDADPKDGDINNNYAIFLCQSGKVSEAQKHFQIALKDPFYGSPEVALTNAGSCAMGAGQWHKADDFLRAALEHNVEFPDALINLVRLNYEEKNYLKARAFMQRYEAVTELSPGSFLLAIQVEMKLNDRPAAKRYLAALNEQYPESKEAKEARRIMAQ